MIKHLSQHGHALSVYRAFHQVTISMACTQARRRKNFFMNWFIKYWLIYKFS